MSPRQSPTALAVADAAAASASTPPRRAPWGQLGRRRSNTLKCCRRISGGPSAGYRSGPGIEYRDLDPVHMKYDETTV